MNVTLVRVTENPVNAIEQAASNCYDSTPTKSGAIMKSCYKSGHHSVLEFCNFHFHIEGVSRALLAQLTRHRMASYAVRSQRYVREDGFGFVIPDTIKKDQFSSVLYRAAMDKIKSAYDGLIKSGIPPEDARYILPNACETVVDVSMNLRELIHFMNERLCTRAQWEIRRMATGMKNVVTEQYPEFADMLVPKCEVHGFCPEEKTCGRHPRLNDLVG
ncbi:MAG TPA: FAD-dependent thymidylate synthase [Lachnospiraceae bacterium]|nr:FAD-dependent thymidylate synthase [Lachnospiraceae bacterium]